VCFNNGKYNFVSFHNFIFIYLADTDTDTDAERTGGMNLAGCQ